MNITIAITRYGVASIQCIPVIWFYGVYEAEGRIEHHKNIVALFGHRAIIIIGAVLISPKLHHNQK